MRNLIGVNSDLCLPVHSFVTSRSNAYGTIRVLLRSPLHSLTAQHSHQRHTISMSHHSINTGTAKPAS